jgi:hypothetical protein
LQLSSPLSMSDSHVSQICLPDVSSATLAAGEWPPANTSVSNSFHLSSVSICIIIQLYRLSLLAGVH